MANLVDGLKLCEKVLSEVDDLLYMVDNHDYSGRLPSLGNLGGRKGMKEDEFQVKVMYGISWNEIVHHQPVYNEVVHSSKVRANSIAAVTKAPTSCSFCAPERVVLI